MKSNIDKLKYLQNVMKDNCQQLPLKMTAVKLPANIAEFEFTDMECDTLAISASYSANKKKSKSKYYVIYDYNGDAIIGLKVFKNKLCDAYEQNQMPLRPLYLHIVKMFLDTNKFTIPSLGVDGAAGLIQQRGKVYNVWELPPNFVIHGDLELVTYSHGPHRKYLTHLPYMSGVTVTGTFNCSFNNLKDLVGCPKAKKIIADYNPLNSVHARNHKTR